MYFPTVIVCNINQIKKSLFRSLSPQGPSSSSQDRKGWERDLLYRQFYAGMDRDLTEEESDVIERIATSEVRLDLVMLSLGDLSPLGPI